MPDTIAVIGGSGSEGYGLCLRWAAAGETIRVGSRSPERARQTAERLKQRLPGADVDGLGNAEAAASARVVVLAVPLRAQIETLRGIRDALQPGALVIDTTVPLENAVGGKVSRFLPLWSGSAAEQAARCLPKGAMLAAALHTVSAHALQHLEGDVDSDVLVVSDFPEARSRTAGLVERIAGVRAIDAGPLENARYAERLAALLIALNVRHKVRSSGVRFTGLPGL